MAAVEFAFQKAKAFHASNKVSLETFNYASLKNSIVPQSFWFLLLESASGPRTVPATPPSFSIHCIDNKETMRANLDGSGLPSANDVLVYVRS
jgi:hypothetical protein